MPHLTASFCESLLQAYLVTETSALKLSCLLTLITLASHQIRTGVIEPIIAKIAQISIVTVCKLTISDKAETI